MKNLFFLIMALSLFVVSCQSSNESQNDEELFEKMKASSTGIDFINQLDYDEDFNIYKYRNFYNGGGVALGDINNDGLIDVYFTSNMKRNKLYLNKGNFQFEDITDKAKVAGTRAWSTGVSFADINGDGWLDIYVCNSGDVKGDNRQNELFINNGDQTFTERAAEYGVVDGGYTTHAAFFDYDKDGDLDLYILNNSYQAIGSFNLKKNERPKRDSLGGHKLLRNDNNHFVDVSESAGVYGSVIGFGLGVTVGDINKDGWPDIYVSNDFFERDYLYINNKNGTFKECLTEQMKSISGASMGADLADINNDTYPDIFVTEMMPEQNDRIKTVTTFESWDRYQYNVANGYHHQFTRNMLQLNNGDDTFSEIGRLAGVYATDWSWGALIFDMDNDGRKDIFVANGIYKDLTNQDYLQFASSEEVVRSVTAKGKVNYEELIDAIPSTKVSNYSFYNDGTLIFQNKAKEWGLGEPSFSNGSAYGDLDNDGDLDLVVNNINMEAFVYRNRSNSKLPTNHYLKFELKGEQKNTAAIGTKITILHNDKKFYLEQMPMRGFESTVDSRPNFGLGNIDTVDLVVVQWPDGRTTHLKNVKTNQTILLNQKDGKSEEVQPTLNPPFLFEERTKQLNIDYLHKENEFVDFDRDRLLFHMLSAEGPRMCKGDVNGDGLDDFYIGGAKDQPGRLYTQTSMGKFISSFQDAFEQDKVSEDTDCVFFDADNDGDQDLYVASGGSEFPTSSTALISRLYFNDGRGNFNRSSQLLPTTNFESASVVKVSDYDKDGDLDLFTGIRFQPFSYGTPVNGYILNNDGKGVFTNVTSSVAPELRALGMIKDAIWADVDGDNDDDLVITGDWMPVTVFFNNSGKFIKSQNVGLANSNGWWNRIKSGDFDNDGDMDFVIGNHGLNSRFKASQSKPIEMYVNDFDQNGVTEQIICAYNGDKSYPMILRHDLVQQMPSLKKKYLKYENYKNQTINDIFSKQQIESSLKLSAFNLSTSLLINDGKGNFNIISLPVEAQFSTVYDIDVQDFDKDGNLDLVLGGNFYKAKPEAGRYDASFGLYLKGYGDNHFAPVSSKVSGLKLEGEIRTILPFKIGKQNYILASRNGDSIQALIIR